MNHIRSGSDISDKSIMGAEMLFNEDYIKKNEGRGLNMGDDDGESVNSIPLSKYSKHSANSKLSKHSKHSRHSKQSDHSGRSGNSRHSRHSRQYNDDESSHPSEVYNSFQNVGRESESSSSSSSSASSYSKGSSKSSSVIVTRKKTMSLDDIMKRKQELLFELDRFEMKGRTYFRKLTLASSLEEIETAHDRLQLDMELDDAIASFRKLLITIVNILEMITNNYFFQKYSPVKVRLSGWSQSVNSEIASYDNVFKKLYIKHRSKTLVGPELQLFFMVSMSGITFHLTSMAADSIPGINEYLKRDPTLFPKFMSFVNQAGAGMLGMSGMPTPNGNQNQNQQYNPNTSANNTNNDGGGFNLQSMMQKGMEFMSGIMLPNNNTMNKSTPPPTQMPKPMNNSMPMPMPNPNVSSPSLSPSTPSPPIQRPQMRGPGNIQDILNSVQQNRLESMSNASESDFSQIPDDVSLSGVISKKPRRVIKK